MEKTFIMLKPDGLPRAMLGEVLSRIEKKGYKILALRVQRMTMERLKEHYAEHVDKPFFPELCEYMQEGPVVQMVIGGDDVIEGMRKMNGATNPAKAEMGSIRGDFALNMTKNLIHASDSSETAQREIALYFTADEIVEW